MMNVTLILSSNASRSITHEDTTIVATPLDAISRLEGHRPISTVLLAGTFARNTEVVKFLAEFYPSVRIEYEV
jgi:hypothetical protein